MRMLIAAFLVMVSLSVHAGPIINGSEWYQPADLTGYSWNDFNAACPAGACTGSVGNNNLSGWSWASVDQVNNLFNGFIGSAELSGPSIYLENNSSWASTIMAVFNPTFNTGTVSFLTGFTATLVPSSGLPHGYVGQIQNWAFLVNDSASTGIFLTADSQQPIVGAWLFREADTGGTIPEPATVVLFAVGLAGFAFARRDKRNNQLFLANTEPQH